MLCGAFFLNSPLCYMNFCLLCKATEEHFQNLFSPLPTFLLPAQEETISYIIFYIFIFHKECMFFLECNNLTAYLENKTKYTHTCAHTSTQPIPSKLCIVMATFSSSISCFKFKDRFGRLLFLPR